ncbi:MAG: NUDIX hydrolase [Verrucomicrobiae bacterium]|nr:NUDIX hydrolase [Verrucomicrobiae bacterium]
MKRKKYSGAGILFVSERCGIDHVLLGCRKRSKIWSIPGGGKHHGETPWDTAIRETTEEFGVIPETWQRVFSIRVPLISVDWTTFVVRLKEFPDPSVFPNRHARDFEREFCDAQWFPIKKPPPRVHYLLRPLFFLIKMQRLVSNLIRPIF